MSGGRAAELLRVGFALAFIACSPHAAPALEVRAELQGATEDAQHHFAVGIKRATVGSAVCSGVLVAPNLVVTARHCVASIDSPIIDCGSSTFGSLMPTAELQVTTSARMDAKAAYLDVAEIIVPSGPEVCGEDIAFLVLDSPVVIAQYAIPKLDPLESATQGVPLVAIGHGLDSPNDTHGLSIGVRRIKHGFSVTCMEPDEAVEACAMVGGRFTDTEFLVAGAGSCSGDSGSAVYDSRLAEDGEWAAIGILSRGSVEDSTCVDSVYARFDAWTELFFRAATRAAARGSYGLPDWAARLGSAPSAPPSANHPAGSCSLLGARPPVHWFAGGVFMTLALGLRRARRRTKPRGNPTAWSDLSCRSSTH